MGILEPPRARVDRLGGLFVQEYDALLRFAYFLTGDRAAAEDLVEEAFVRLSETSSRIEENGFPAYARRTVLNLRRSTLRRLVVERRFLRLGDTRVPTDDPGGRDAEREVQAALLALPVRQRACLALRYCEGLKEHEIAEILGVSLASVKKTIERGMRRLAVMLGDEGGS